MSKLLFEYLTEPFSLSDKPMKNYILMALVGFLAYLIAYNFVGKLCRNGSVFLCDAGSILHWMIRLVAFVIIFL